MSLGQMTINDTKKLNSYRIMTDLLDYVVVGGGIAGLYANTKLTKRKKMVCC